MNQSAGVPDDVDRALAESIISFAAGGHPVERTIQATCSCGGRTFQVLFDDEVGVAARVCAACDDEIGMLDSDDHLDEVEEVQIATCTCGGRRFRVAVGFAFADDGELRWVSIGLSCVNDGIAGVYADWKIDYAPSRHLLDAV
ncbi:hypothetical protein [Agromyces sp. Root81]|uniref:hypothetical protein n=1 Tax=Agromyces sp. Root81 TaxID=1736601 RepID=UPI000ADA6852|nr:hypothetical protein [Agromyces sp. Root81]